MTTNNPLLDASDTRQRLLEAGMHEFAEKGIDAGIRQICARAGANPAAVNYHFGNKQKFYAEVLVTCHQQAVAKRPMPRLADDPEHPDRIFERWIRWFLELLLVEGGGSPLGKLMMREMLEPTEAFDALVTRSIYPIFRTIGEIVHALLAPTDPQALRLHVNSVMGQCLVYRHTQPALARLEKLDLPGELMPPDLIAPSSQDLDALASHIARFSLAGLKHPSHPSSGDSI